MAFLDSVIGLVPSAMGYYQQIHQANKDRAFQYQMWKETNQYNSPSNQARLLQNAGFSPSAMFQGSTPGQASMPSVGTHSIQPIMSELESNPFKSFSTIAQAIQSISQADKNVAELPKIQAEIDKMFGDAHLSSAKAEYQDLYNSFYKAYGRKMMDADVNEKVSNFVLNLSRARLAIEEGNTQESVRLMNLAKRDELDALSGLHGAERSKVEADTKFLVSSLDLRLQNLKSDTALKSASARNQMASAEQMEFYNELRQKPEVKKSLISEIITAAENAKKSGKIMDSQVNQIKWQCKQLEKANDNYEIQMWSGIINNTINTAANAVGEFTKFGLAKKFLDSKPSTIESGNGFMMNNDGILFRNPYK